MGEAGAAFADEALDRDDLRAEVKWRLVRALSRSSAPEAVDRLAARLATVEDTALRVRILRALRAAQAEGAAPPLDRARLVALAEEDVGALGRALAFRLSQAELLARSPELGAAGAELLQKLLRDKEREAEERLFLVLTLLYPRERITRIQRGLASPNPKTRASSRELLENVLRPPLRSPVLTLTDDVDDRARAERLGVLRGDASYAGLLAAMIEQGGEVGAVAAFHAAELGMRDSLRAAIDRLRPGGAFARLGSSPPPALRGGAP